MVEWAVRTSTSPDGVVGLNGWFYLEDDDGQMMLFPSLEAAQQYISDAGENPDDEYLEYTEVEHGSIRA